MNLSSLSLSIRFHSRASVWKNVSMKRKACFKSFSKHPIIPERVSANSSYKEKNNIILKANRPHPRNYQHMPTDYIHIAKYLRLVMTLIALCCTRKSRAPVPKIQVKGQTVKTGELGQTYKQTHIQTDATKCIISVHYLPSALSPCFTVDKYSVNSNTDMNTTYIWCLSNGFIFVRRLQISV